MLKKFENFKSTVDNFKIIRTTVNSNISQKYLNEYLPELSIFKKMKQANVDKSDRNINLYFYDDIFIGFLVTKENHFKFNSNKEIIGYDTPSKFNTIIIAYIEVRQSIRKNKEYPRFGKIILDKFIEENENKYDAITIQADNDFLQNIYYPKYGFINSNSNIGVRTMVRWS